MNIGRVKSVENIPFKENTYHGLSPGRCNGDLSTDLISTQWVEMRSVDRPHFDPLGGNEVC